MIREFHLADFFTLANAACGVAAIFFALAYVDDEVRLYFYAAAAMAPAAFLFDVLDGRIARWRQHQSPLGRELDSLADVVSFGVAPAALAFAAGMRGGWDMLTLTYFVVCGVSRLARFNATAADLTDQSTGKVRYFQGTPIPTSILLVMMLAVAFALDRIEARLWLGDVRIGPGTLHPLVLMFAASGSAMISATLRVPKP